MLLEASAQMTLRLHLLPNPPFIFPSCPLDQNVVAKREERSSNSFLPCRRSKHIARPSCFLPLFSDLSLALAFPFSLTSNHQSPATLSPLGPGSFPRTPDPHTTAFSALIDRPSSPCVARPSPSSRSPLSLSPFPAPTPALSLALPSAAHVINRVALHLPGPPVSRLFPRPAPLSGRLTLGFSLQDILHPRPPLTLASAASVER